MSPTATLALWHDPSVETKTQGQDHVDHAQGGTFYRKVFLLTSEESKFQNPKLFLDTEKIRICCENEQDIVFPLGEVPTDILNFLKQRGCLNIVFTKQTSVEDGLKNLDHIVNDTPIITINLQLPQEPPPTELEIFRHVGEYFKYANKPALEFKTIPNDLDLNNATVGQLYQAGLVDPKLLQETVHVWADNTGLLHEDIYCEVRKNNESAGGYTAPLTISVG